MKRILILCALLVALAAIGAGWTWGKSVAPSAASWVDAPTVSQFGW